MGGRGKTVRRVCHCIRIVAWTAAATWIVCAPNQAEAQRSLGLDVSAWQGNISQTTWNNIHNGYQGDAPRDFVFIRSSRGGTTGFYNQSNASNTNPPGQNTLSQRYDDPYFVQNITRATNAGMFAGPYHFGRMDIVAGTPYSGGIANTGTDEANHFIQMAGAWMRPGYLVPVFDFEAGSGIRTPEQLAQFAIDFSNRIYEVMKIRPAVYIGNNYSSPMESIPSAQAIVDAYPTLWIARWPNQADPNSIPVQTANPGDYTASVYGPWDNPPNPPHPWDFWQYASTGRLKAFNNGNSDLDFDVARGGTDFLKDNLVPAVWWTDSSGDWSTLTNWNSGQTPVAPVQGPGQVPRVGPLTLPNPRIPGGNDAANNVYGHNDTVILDRPTANITVTVSNGDHFIRKLYLRETLNISAGASLAGEFAQVGAGHTINLNGGQIAFNTLELLPHPTTPAKLALNADADFTFLSDYPTTVVRGAGAGKSGFVDLGNANRTIGIAESVGALTFDVPVVNGGITKTGPGTLAINGPNTLLDSTTIAGGTLSVRRRVFANAADINLPQGGALELNYTGTPDRVRSLTINGMAKAPGTYGAPGSGADNIISDFFLGTGMLLVDPSAPPDNNFGNVIDDFEVDEGHFGWPYNFSPISQTFGLAAGTTIDRVTTQHQGEGTASQLLNLVANGSNWQLRHNSGIDQAANPAGNTSLEAIGSIGFWLKTDDPGITVRLGIDDPVGGNNALERGTALNVIADNQWHLYQWDFEDEGQWDPFAGGANGVIDAPSGFVTIDSIWFAGIGNAQIYLDTVLHNPDGTIGFAQSMSGDLNGDGTVNLADYLAWRRGFGTIYTMADYENWRANFGANTGGGSASHAAIPEPSALLLILSAAALGFALRRPGRP